MRSFRFVGCALLLAAASSPAADRPGLGLMVSYFGELGTHPGLNLGVDYPVARLGEPHELFVRGQLGGYLQPRLFGALFVGGEVGARSTARSGLRGEVGFGVAFLHALLASPVYEVGSDGQVTASRALGRSGLMPSVFLGVGWDFGRRTGLPLVVMLRPMAFWQIPVNSAALLHVAGLLSFTYAL